MQESTKDNKMNTFGPESVSPEYEYMYEKWQLPLTLMGGVRQMQAAGKVYLPIEPRESEEAYQVRLKRSSLFNVFKKTIMSASGQALMSPVTVSNVPKELEYLETNATGDGRSLTEIANDLIEHHLLYGKAHGLVDFPAAAKEGELSYAEFKLAGFRPYVNVVNPQSLINWDYNVYKGYPELDRINIQEKEIIRHPDSPWVTMQRRQVRVWWKDRVEVYIYNDDDQEYVLDEQVYDNTLGYVPLVTGYANKAGFLIAEPPLEDLAYLNLTHWQSSSDQRNILHVARVPFILATGFADGELNGMELGVNRVVTTSSAEADMKYVEHTAKSVDSGFKDLEQLEHQMKISGADLIMGQSVSRQTAAARQIDLAESMSLMQLTLRSTAHMLKKFYEIAGDWLGIDASGVEITIGDDLSLPNSPNPVPEMVMLVGLMQDLGFSRDDIIAEIKRRGIIGHTRKYDMNTVMRMLNGEEAGNEPVVEEDQTEESTNNSDNEQDENDDSQNENETDDETGA